MASVDATLRGILERNCVSAPDGRALYAYRTTTTEYEMVREALMDAQRTVARLDRVQAAALCMFVAEYVRRSHAGGPWTWRDAIVACAFRGPQQDLYGAVLRGLAYWRRPLLVSGSDREFLLTLMCEGGLPLQLLKRDNQRLTAYFRELLSAREMFPLTPTALLAARCADRLPVSLRNDVVFQLGASLVDVVARLRATVGMTDNPVRTLDARSPTWRDQVPLSIEDDVAKALLEGLLRSPPPSAARVAQLTMGTVLRIEGEPSIGRVLQLPPQMSRQELAEQLALEDVTLPSRIYLHVVGHDGTRRHVAVASATADGHFNFQRVASPRLEGEAAVLSAFRLVASTGSRDLATIVPAGAEALAPTTPWVFRDGETKEMVAAGSAQTRADSFLLAVGEGELEVCSGAVDELGRLASPPRRVLRLRGEAIWNGEESRCRVRTGYVGPETPTFSLSGSVHSFGFSGAELWSNVPHVLEMESDGRSKAIPPERIQYRLAAPDASWRPRSEQPRGAIVLRVVQDDEVRFLTRLTVVPPDLKVSLATDGGDRGAITIEGGDLDDVGVVPIPNVQADLTRLAVSGRPSFRIAMRAEPPTPATVELALRFRGGGQVRLQVPFPVWSRYFATPSGVPIENGRKLALNALAGITARAVSPRPHILEGRLRGQPWEYLGRLRVTTDMCTELSLEAIRDRVEALFASSQELDALVELHLIEEGRVLAGAPTLEIRRYDAWLVPEPLQGGTQLTLRMQGDEAVTKSLESSLRVEALPLWRLAEQATALVRADDGTFFFDHAGRSAGPWLLLGWEGERLRLRPLMVTVQGELSQHPRNELEEAVRTGDPDDRHRRLRAVVEGLGQNYGNAAWPQVFSYLDALERYPATTFDVVKTLSRNDNATAMALLKTEGRRFERFWRSLEELPFMWALVPLRSWVNAVRQLRAWAVPTSAELGWSRSQLIADRLEALRKHGPVLGAFTSTIVSLVPALIQDAPDVDTTELDRARTQTGRAQLKAVLSAEYQRLLLRHPDADDSPGARWPVFHVQELTDEHPEVRQLFERHALHDPVGFRHGPLDVPIFAAAMSMVGERPTDAQLRAMRRARAFDETWFDFAHAFAWTCMLGERLENDRDALDGL